MLTVISIMLLGIGLGYLLRGRSLPFLSQLITVLIWILLGLLGIEVGGNKTIMQGVASLGCEGGLIAFLSVVGASLGAWGLWRVSSIKDTKKESHNPRPSLFVPLRGSAIIIAFFAGGAGIGAAGWLSLSALDIDISFGALTALMFCVGISVGHDRTTLASIRQLPPLLMLLPVLTIVGTIVGAASSALLLPHRSLSDCLAIGSGMGYYSLSSIFITQYRGAELGTIALLANIAREIITLVGAPLLARFFGPLAPISSGGATSMDTTLPVITAVSGKEYLVLAVFHGFFSDLSVPFLVTLFCSL